MIKPQPNNDDINNDTRQTPQTRYHITHNAQRTTHTAHILFVARDALYFQILRIEKNSFEIVISFKQSFNHNNSRCHFPFHSSFSILSTQRKREKNVQKRVEKKRNANDNSLLIAWLPSNSYFLWIILCVYLKIVQSVVVNALYGFFYVFALEFFT